MAGAVRDVEPMQERDMVDALERAQHNLKIARKNLSRWECDLLDCLDEVERWRRIIKKERDNGK